VLRHDRDLVGPAELVAIAIPETPMLS
jgi:hypothetical protein